MTTPAVSAKEKAREIIKTAIRHGCADELNGNPCGDILVKGCAAAEYVHPEDAAEMFVECIADEVLAALSATEVEPEPVAWGSESALKMIAAGVHATIHPYAPPLDPVPLYRRPPSAPAGVKVKPLEWKEYETEGEIDRWDTETALGTFYEIITEFDGYHVAHDYTHWAVKFETPDEAKAAAQTDYEQRIRSSLQPDTQAARCEYCDGTGDVHSIDGEWRGRCACPAGAAALRWSDQLKRMPTDKRVFENQAGSVDTPAEAMWSPKLEALRLLAAEDKRQLQLLELLETIREQIRLGVKAEHRPEGLFKNIQDAVYALRGRLPLMNDAALTAPLRASSPLEISPAAMTERLIEAAVYYEQASGVYVAGARKELNEARAAIEAALSFGSAQAEALPAGVREALDDYHSAYSDYRMSPDDSWERGFASQKMEEAYDKAKALFRALSSAPAQEGRS